MRSGSILVVLLVCVPLNWSQTATQVPARDANLTIDENIVSVKDLAGPVSPWQIEIDMATLSEMFLQEERMSANASTTQLISIHSSKEWIELHTRMGYLRDELKRAEVGDDEAAVKTYRQISATVDHPRTKGEFVNALRGSSEKDRMSAIRELGCLFYRAQGDDNEIAVLRSLLLEIGTDPEAPPNLTEMFLHAQLSADPLDSAAATLLCAQVGLSEDQAHRMMASLVSKRFSNNQIDWEIRRMYDLSLQLIASHGGRGDAKGAAYAEFMRDSIR